MRTPILTPLAIALFLLPVAAAAKTKTAGLPTCSPLPENVSSRPWHDGERLYYDVDVMGAFAGKLTLIAHAPSPRLGEEEIHLRALAASNSFFSKIRTIRGRASSHLRLPDLRPRSYGEETREGEIERSATVHFERSKRGMAMNLESKRNGRTSRKRYRHTNDAFDPLSAFYALRAMKLEEGQSICFDAYGIRRHWRVSGTVKAREVVKVPAGAFSAYRIEGKAFMVDDPSKSREIHVWISADERRLPLAALGVMDLGPVRAQLTRIDGEVDEELERAVASEMRRRGPEMKAPRDGVRLR